MASGVFLRHRFAHIHTDCTTQHSSPPIPITDAAVSLSKSDPSECATSPNVTTDCFPFQLHAVAPVASNGWVLTGEVGKFLPMSANRVASVAVKPGGGFVVAVRGGAGERVRFGAADYAGGGVVKYFDAVLDANGTATIDME